jgi:hypothetical protein
MGKKKVDVKLCGADGNAYAILGRVARELRRSGYTEEEIEKFQIDATSGDYNHLLSVTMKWANDAGDDDDGDDDLDVE